MNIKLSQKLIIQLVKSHGVKTFCICPGGRNAPLMSVISHTKGLNVFSFFEERSAGFFALGRSRRDKTPVAIITTSGTAVAELLPCVIEAYYTQVPLILITADRPSCYRKKGVPQTIQQIGIFSHYVKHQYELEDIFNLDIKNWDHTSPCHINICFEEPLIDAKNKELIFYDKDFKSVLIKNQNPTLKNHAQQIKDFFKKAQTPLCILAELPIPIQPSIEHALSFYKGPIYAEALSGLRESPKLDYLILKSGDNFLKQLAIHKKIDGILRIGRRPCTRFWLDLEKSYSDLPILSVSDQHYSGLNRAPLAVSFKAFLEHKMLYTTKQNTSSQSLILAQDKKYTQKLNTVLNKHPDSELALIKQFSYKIPDNSMVFLGNSLPIREWNKGATYKNKNLKYISNRGANGIDGLLSTFLGACELNKQNWCVIGDLSCLYDLTAPWVLPQLNKNMQCFFLIINNKGGQIFSDLFSDPLFIQSHNLQFNNWAKMWNLNYYKITQWPKDFNFISPAVIELQVDYKSLSY